MQRTQTSLFVIFFLSLVLFSCQKLDPIFNELEGSYSGTILIDEVYRSYNEGVAPQDTMVRVVQVSEDLELRIERDKFETCEKSGVIRVEGDSLTFFIDLEASNNSGCGSFFSGFPQYAYQFSVSADSLKVDLLDEGVAELIGSHNRQFIRIKRQLRLVRN